jgi:hypothetical protein
MLLSEALLCCGITCYAASKQTLRFKVSTLGLPAFCASSNGKGEATPNSAFERTRVITLAKEYRRARVAQLVRWAVAQRLSRAR